MPESNKYSIFRAFEKGLIEDRDHSYRALFEVIIQAGARKQERAAALLSLCSKLLPRLPYEKILYHPENLTPIVNLDDYYFRPGTIGRGGTRDVYLLEAKREGIPTQVLKINRRLHASYEELTRVAKLFEQKFSEIRRWYAELPHLIPIETPYVIESPQRINEHVLVTIQSFLGYELKHLFSLSKTELAHIISQSPNLRNDLLQFANITLDNPEIDLYFLDILGAQNLVLAREDNETRLFFLDPLTLGFKEATSDKEIKRVQETKDRVQDLRELVI